MSIRALSTAVVLSLSFVGLAMAQPASRPAQTPQAEAAAVTTTTRSDEGYVLGPEDVVEVEVLGRSDFKVRGKIASDGSLQLPFIGATPASNRTPQQLAEYVRGALEKGGYYTKPIMRVEVVSYASRYVTVLGAVGSPGLVPVDRQYRLSEVLARVGGVRDNAADYVTLRSENGPERRISINSLATGNTADDPIVRPGDKIFLPKAEVFYISGQVRQPGSYPVATDMTLRMALAKGGGLTELGSEKGIKVTRAGGRAEKLPLEAKIMPGDVIVVPERFF